MMAGKARLALVAVGWKVKMQHFLSNASSNAYSIFWMVFAGFPYFVLAACCVMAMFVVSRTDRTVARSVTMPVILINMLIIVIGSQLFAETMVAMAQPVYAKGSVFLVHPVLIGVAPWIMIAVALSSALLCAAKHLAQEPRVRVRRRRAW